MLSFRLMEKCAKDKNQLRDRESRKIDKNKAPNLFFFCSVLFWRKLKKKKSFAKNVLSSRNFSKVCSMYMADVYFGGWVESGGEIVS